MSKCLVAPRELFLESLAFLGLELDQLFGDLAALDEECLERGDARRALLLGGNEESGEHLMHGLEGRADGTSGTGEVPPRYGTLLIDLAFGSGTRQG